MSDLWSLYHLSFTSPRYLLVLLVVPLLVLFAVIIRRRRARYTVAFTNMTTLAGAIAKRPTRWRRYVPLTLLALALAATGAALARPHISVTVSDRSATIILLVDVSGSMQAPDITPSRMDAAVAAMHDFVDKLPKNYKVGLVTFSESTSVVVAPTNDRAAISSGLDVLSPQAGTALGDGVAAAVKIAVSSLAASGVYQVAGEYLPAAIVLESDGAQTRGTLTPFAAASVAKAAGVRIYGVALGTPGGRITQGAGLLRQSIPVPPDPGTVAMLAHDSGGQAFAATDAESLNTTYRSLGSSIAHRSRQKDITSWFELAAAILLVAGVGTARAWGASLSPSS